MLGFGYCFLVFLFFMLVIVVIEFLRLIDEKLGMFVELRENCEKIYSKLSDINGIVIVGEFIFLVKYIRFVELSIDRDFDV